MSRSNKGIRDLVKDSRIGSEIRVSSSHSSSNNITGIYSQTGSGVGGGIGGGSMNPKMAKINSNIYSGNGSTSTVMNNASNTGIHSIK